jgi:hypothetical protein
MAYIIQLEYFIDRKGILTVGDGVLPFTIKRFYFMMDNMYARAECRHEKSIQAIFCVCGSCNVYINNGKSENNFILNVPSQCLVIEKNDWHRIDNFSANSVLVVFSSEHYESHKCNSKSHWR